MENYQQDRRKIYYQNNRERLLQTYKEYRDTHKENRAKYDKAYRANRREQINKTIQCDICGKSTSSKHLARHKRSKKCQAIVV